MKYKLQLATLLSVLSVQALNAQDASVFSLQMETDRIIGKNIYTSYIVKKNSSLKDGEVQWIVAKDRHSSYWPQNSAKLWNSQTDADGNLIGKIALSSVSSFPLEFYIVSMSAERASQIEVDMESGIYEIDTNVGEISFASNKCTLRSFTKEALSCE